MTVQDVQVANQLLNPQFPIILYPRNNSLGAPTDAATAAGDASASSSASSSSSQQRKFNLPGLHRRGDSFPTLHVFFQLQHQTKAGVEIIGEQAGTGASLLYFDAVTLWVAPMKIDADEEVLVRSIRFINALRSSWQRPDTALSVGSQSSAREDILALQHQGARTWGLLSNSLVAEKYSEFADTGQQVYIDWRKSKKINRFLYFSLLQLHPVDIVMNFHAAPNFVISGSEMAIVDIVAQLV